MATTSWGPPGAWTAGLGATDLNALANNGVAFSSLTAPQIDNRATGEIWAQFEFTATGTMSPASGAAILVGLIPLLSDDVTYADGEAGTTGANVPAFQNYPHTAIALRTKATSTQAQQSPLILVPPGAYKLAVYNRAGVALPATGSMVKWRFLTETVA